MSHRLIAFDSLCKYYPEFEGMKILEIAGHADCEAVIPFAERGAICTVTGLDHIHSPSNVSRILQDRITVLRADALSLAESFEHETFDLVFGVSCLEHIPNPSTLLESIWSVLRPGGMVFLEGAPLWSSPRGHHLWAASWNLGTSRDYTFVEPTCVLPDWSHIYMNEDEMKLHLHGSGIPEPDINAIVNWVFHLGGVNRINFSDLNRAIFFSSFSVVSTEFIRWHAYNMTSEFRLRLAACMPGELYFDIDGVRYVLQKP